MEAMKSDTMEVGIYSLPEAARLLRVTPSRLSNWANGYTYKRKEDLGTKPPVLLTNREHTRVINFREMFELMAVREFRKFDVKLETIREVAKRLAAELNTPYPFASQELFVNGKKIVREHGTGFIQVDTGQIVMERIHGLVKELEFEANLVAAWKPRHGRNDVLVTPAIQFGDPIVAGTRIPTRSIFRLFVAEQDLDIVADQFDITVEQVKHVLQFEQSLAEAV